MKNKIISKIKDIIFWISRIAIFVVIGLMIFVPFLVKNTSFTGDDVVIFNKKVNVMAVEGKVNVKAFDTYFKTTIDYNKYDLYIESSNNNSYFKKVFLLELLLIFVLFETVIIYYILKTINNLLIDRENDPYKLYLSKKAFSINVLSFLIFEFIKRFIFRNTIFSSLDLGTCLFQLFVIVLFYVVYKVVEDHKVTISNKDYYGKK
jgi:hypothetical protein